ncbi:tail fiber domain-containing protein [Nostoc linckia]|uniref:tail fiber domain-containing protein n=1 Tax=Nostoc linckia TaxID=92942 RepID=UPI000BFFE629|nr:tail fiber domain-containing protein [Nostoc linckia]
MRRIAGTGATVDNKFTGGNPVTGTPFTVVTSDWLNIVQETICHVITTAGITIDQSNPYPDNDLTQLTDAILALAVPAALSITNAMLADASVNATKIQDLAVTTAKIAAQAVTSAKLADGSVVTDRLAAGAVTSAKLANNAVDSQVNAYLATEFIINNTRYQFNGLNTGCALQFWVGSTTWNSAGAESDLRIAPFSGSTTKTRGARIHMHGYSDVTNTSDWHMRIDGATGTNFGSFAWWARTGTGGYARQYLMDATSFFPEADDARDLGLVTNRWDDVYATNATIQTSDETEKQDIEDLGLNWPLMHAIKAKSFRRVNGDSGRLHAGFVAQQVAGALEQVGIDTADYAALVKTEWQTPSSVLDADGNPMGFTTHERWGMRYEEQYAQLWPHVCDLDTRLSAQQAVIDSLTAQVATLTAAVAALQQG